MAAPPSTSAVTAAAVSKGAELTAPNALSTSQTTPNIALTSRSRATPRKHPTRRAIRLPWRRH